MVHQKRKTPQCKNREKYKLKKLSELDGQHSRYKHVSEVNNNNEKRSETKIGMNKNKRRYSIQANKCARLDSSQNV